MAQHDPLCHAKAWGPSRVGHIPYMKKCVGVCVCYVVFILDMTNQVMNSIANKSRESIIVSKLQLPTCISRSFRLAY